MEPLYISIGVRSEGGSKLTGDDSKSYPIPVKRGSIVRMEDPNVFFVF